MNGSLTRWILKPVCRLISPKGLKMNQCLDNIYQLIESQKLNDEVIA